LPGINCIALTGLISKSIEGKIYFLSDLLINLEFCFTLLRKVFHVLFSTCSRAEKLLDLCVLLVFG
jgi:hypothetical protein